jgi:hypothetical protein
MSVSIIVEGPRTTRRYRSISSATRTLTGTGRNSDALRMRISRTVRNGGGYVGANFVARAK